MAEEPKRPTLEECHAAGMTVPEAAKAMGRSDSTVYRQATARGLKFAHRRGWRARLPAEQEAKLQSCHAAGMTVPETAKAMGKSDGAIYRLAKLRGLKFAHRKVGPPPLTPKQEAKRAAAHRAMMEKRRTAARNGFTWEGLHRAGFTACESARLRGTTFTAAYIWAKKYGKKWPRHHADPKRNPVAGLTPAERAEYDRLRNTKGAGRDLALEMIGRRDLVERNHNWRFQQLAQRDPEAAMLALMQARKRSTRGQHAAAHFNTTDAREAPRDAGP